MAILVDRNTGDVIPASDHNDVKDYIEDGIESVNTLSLSIQGSEVIDSLQNITSILNISADGDLIAGASSTTGRVLLGDYAIIESRLNTDLEQSCSLTSTQSIDMQLGLSGWFNLYNSTDTFIGGFNDEGKLYCTTQLIQPTTSYSTACLQIINALEIAGTYSININHASAGSPIYINQNWGDEYGIYLYSTSAKLSANLYIESTTTTASAIDTYNGTGSSFTSITGMIHSNIAGATSTGHGFVSTNKGLGHGIYVNQDGNGIGIYIDSEATTKPGIKVDSIYINAIETIGNIDVTGDITSSGSLVSGTYATFEGKLNSFSDASCSITSTKSIDMYLGSSGYFSLFYSGGTQEQILTDYLGTITTYNSSGTQTFRISSAGNITVDGNILVSGTVDGIDIATDVAANTSKVTNATHTGDATGSTVLTLANVSITGKTVVTAVGTDYVLLSDTSDSGNLKKALASDFGSAPGGSDTELQYNNLGSLGGITDATTDGTNLKLNTYKLTIASSEPSGFSAGDIWIQN